MALDGLALEPVFLGNLRIEAEDFCEDGETFRDNAFKKARYFWNKTGLTTVAEDSGIIVDALKGELGVKTRRWGAGEDATDEEWIKYFMEKMGPYVADERGAKFCCAACLIDDDGREYFFEGETMGRISEELMAPVLPGLPLSSCFIPEGYEQVYAALGHEEKNKISHRGKAIQSLRKFLETKQ